MKKRLFILTLLVVLVTFTSCFITEADRVNHNISKQASYFETVRRITVYNTWTDTIFMELEGRLDISNNTSNELVVTCKIGEDKYKKNYIYLNKFVTYTVEDITGTVTDPYHYRWVINKHIIPSVEIK